MALQGIKRASLIFAGLLSVKKPILTQSSLLQALLSSWNGALVKNLFEEELNGNSNKNNKNNKTAKDNNLLLKELNEDDNVQFVLFRL